MPLPLDAWTPRTSRPCDQLHIYEPCLDPYSLTNFTAHLLSLQKLLLETSFAKINIFLQTLDNILLINPYNMPVVVNDFLALTFTRLRRVFYMLIVCIFSPVVIIYVIVGLRGACSRATLDVIRQQSEILKDCLHAICPPPTQPVTHTAESRSAPIKTEKEIRNEAK